MDPGDTKELKDIQEWPREPKRVPKTAGMTPRRYPTDPPGEQTMYKRTQPHLVFLQAVATISEAIQKTLKHLHICGMILWCTC